MANPQETYALVWDAQQARFHSATVRRSDRESCYLYTATDREPYLSKLAENFGLELRQLLIDNVDKIATLDGSILGSTLLLCGIDQDAIKLVVQSPSPPPPPPPAPAAFLTTTTTTSSSSSSSLQIGATASGAAAAGAVPVQQRAPPARLPTLYTENGCTCKPWTSYAGQTCNYSIALASGPWCNVVESGCGSSGIATGSWDYVETPPKQVCQ